MYKIIGFVLGLSGVSLIIVFAASSFIMNEATVVNQVRELSHAVDEARKVALNTSYQAVDTLSFTNNDDADSNKVKSNVEAPDELLLDDLSSNNKDVSSPLAVFELAVESTMEELEKQVLEEFDLSISDETDLAQSLEFIEIDESYFQENAIAWEVFWKFDSKYAAKRFAAHLEKLTGLDIDVFQKQNNLAVVAYAYTTEEERIRNKSILEDKASIKLRESKPLSIAYN